MRRPWGAALVALLCLGGCASAPSQGTPDFSRPEITDLQAQLERDPIGPGEAVRIIRLVDSPDMSGLLVQVRGALQPHFHKLTQEVVYMLRGEGLFQLGTSAFRSRRARSCGFRRAGCIPSPIRARPPPSFSW